MAGGVRVFAVPLIGIVLLNILGHCEMSIYPGLRRKPLQNALQTPYEVQSDFLAQLMEENARRRLQQQFEHQLELINMQMSRQRQRQEQRERYRQQQLQQQQQQEQQQQLQFEVLQAENENDNQQEDEDYANNINNNNNNNNNPYDDDYDNSNPDFSFKYPNVDFDSNILRQRIQFGVAPPDPRFYLKENTDTDASELSSAALDEYEEYVPAESNLKDNIEKVASPHAGDAPPSELIPKQKDATNSVLAPLEMAKISDSAATTTFHRIKPQTAAAAAVVGVNVASMKPAALNVVAANNQQTAANTRHDINALIDKLQQQGKSDAIMNSREGGALLSSQSGDEHMVVRQHMGIDGDMGIYVVALIAGLSAAVTVGLIALGIAWYTLHNKTKAAADVEYPAYGVTGPNKDISPSGDRKLAQSAQMYHYQHQKQQIIAMENRQAVEGACGLSDVESDDDNEEGDYTVYECPGLAPTGEMEVKNPLFLDETPMTPANNNNSNNNNNNNNAVVAAPPLVKNITQATPQQPPTERKQSGKGGVAAAAAAATTSATADEKKKKNKK